MAELWDDQNATIATIARWQERKRQVQHTADSITPRQAVDIQRLARFYPFVSPGVLRGLGQSGVGPDDPVTQFAVTQELLRNFSTKGSWSGQLGLQSRPMPKGRPDPMSFISRTSGNTSRATMLIKKAEELGVFNADTQVLIEPDENDQPDAYKVFTDLADEIFYLGKSPVPFVARDGKVRGYSPTGEDTSDLTFERFEEGVTQPQFDLRSGIQVDPSVYSGPFAEQFGGPEFTHAAKDWLATEQTRNAGDLINEIFLASESNPITEATRQAARAQQAADARMAGLTPNLGAVAPTLRGMFMAFDAPIQEITGQVRNVYALAHGDNPDWFQSQSDLGIAIPRALRGENVDIGSGLFVDPESQVARDRRTREATRGQIGGHNLSVGRILANGINIEPDTKPFYIVSGLADGVMQLADPTAYGLGTASDVSKSRKFFATEDALAEAGAFTGMRRIYNGPTFRSWATKNSHIFDRLAELDSPYEIARLTNFKLGPEMEGTISRIPDPENVRRYVEAEIERGHVRTTDQLKPGRVNTMKRGWVGARSTLQPSYTPRSTRMLQMMPGQSVDLDQPRQVANTLRRVMLNAHANEAEVANIYNKVALARNRNDLRGAVISSMSGTEGVRGLLQRYGISDDLATELTRLNKNTYAEDLRGHIDEFGADVPSWDVIGLDGIPTKIPGPTLPMEHIGQFMFLPDQRAIRRLTSKFNWITASQTDIPVITRVRRKSVKVKGKTIKAGTEPIRNPQKIGAPRWPTAAADYVMSEVLKPLWLARLAWPVRVVGEEQLRGAAAGLDTMTKHPISYISTVLGGERTRMTRLLNFVTPGVGPKMDITPSGAFFDETQELKNATYRAHGGWISQPGVIRTRQPTTFNKNNPDEVNDWRSSWAHELALLHNDPVSNYVANNTFDDAVEWLLNGPGRKYRSELISAHPGNLETPQQVMDYVTLVSDRIIQSTANHPDLIDIVKSGKWSTFKGDKEVVSSIFHDVPAINPQFTHHLRGYDEIGPEKIKGRANIRYEESLEFPARWSAGVDRLFSVLMGQPTSVLSRSPAFRQFVWRRAAELLPYADDAARTVILANAKKAGLNARQMRTLERAAVRGKKGADGVFTGKLNADDVDFLARGYALDDTKELLYDLSERSQIADILRIVIPFGEAWKEVITRWAKLATIQGPAGIPLPGKPVRRFQQTVMGARGTDFGAFMGTGMSPVYDPETGEIIGEKQRGFFYKNEFGEEVYAYPGSEWFTSAVTGVPVPLTGRVQGLNMFGTIVPGLGPVAQIPIAWYLQDKPQLEAWREMLLPFGAPGDKGDRASIGDIKSYLPAWAKTAFDIVTEGGYDDRIWNSSIMYTASYLYSTGEYGDTVDEQQRLLEDAKEAVKGTMGWDGLYGIRMFGQFMLPSSPTFEWVTKVEDGSLVNTRILAEEFYRLQKEDYDTATERFLEQYGPDAIGAIVPHSRAVIAAAPTSLEAAQWVAKHPSVKKKFDLVYGFFAPEGEFHMPTYARNFLSGERDAITPKQWLNLRDTMLGNYHYEKAKNLLGQDRYSPNEEQAVWLRQQKEAILEAYPNWNNTIGLAGKATEDNERMIRQLQDAAKDRTVRGTDAGKALVEYLKFRDKAVQQAEDAGFASFKTANKMAGTRQWLTDKAYDLIQQYPDFERLWDVVFSREMEDATIEPPRPGGG